MHFTEDHRQFCHVGDQVDNCKLGFFLDASFDEETQDFAFTTSGGATLTSIRADIWQGAGSDREDCNADGGGAATDARTSEKIGADCKKVNPCDSGGPLTLAQSTRAKVSPTERARARERAKAKAKAKAKTKANARQRQR